MSEVMTTAEVDAQYKSKVPKFPEKLSFGDTDDYAGVSLKMKAFTVSCLSCFVLWQ